MDLDLYLFHLLNDFALTNSNFGALAIIAASPLIYVLGVWYVVAFVWHKRGGMLDFFALALGGGLGYTFNKIVSILWFRPRPFITEHLVPLIFPSSEKSFPSDHATAAFFIATLLFCHKWSWWWAYLLAVAVALGRVAIGVHYPTDIIAGAIIGITFGILASKIEKLIKRRV